jgi:hypothetical protein
LTHWIEGDALNDIRSYIEQLRFSLGNGRPTVSRKQLRSFFAAKDYAGMVKFIRDSMNLDVRLRLGVANGGGPPNAIAWIPLPPRLPSFGSREFRAWKFTVFIRKSFLDEGRFEQVVMAIAHELSHVVLHGLNHPLRECEVAVDLTAMLLGYRDFYLDGCEYLETRPIEFWPRFQHELRHAFRRTSKPRLVKSISYLKPEEVAYAAYHLGATAIRQKQFRARKDVAYILANLLRRLSPLLFLIGLCVCLGLFVLIAGLFAPS